MAKRPTNNGASWSAGELRTWKQLAKAGTAQAAARQLGRTPAAGAAKSEADGYLFSSQLKSRKYKGIQTFQTRRVAGQLDQPGAPEHTCPMCQECNR
jgi:hypothetical protein